MVEVLDVLIKRVANVPPDQGHDALKQAEKEGNAQERPQLEPFEDDAAGDGNGKTIHGQAKCNQEDVD